jgi:hypothetical protein
VLKTVSRLASKSSAMRVSAGGVSRAISSAS